MRTSLDHTKKVPVCACRLGPLVLLSSSQWYPTTQVIVWRKRLFSEISSNDQLGVGSLELHIVSLGSPLDGVKALSGRDIRQHLGSVVDRAEDLLPLL